MTYLWIAIGGAIGSIARYGLGTSIARLAGGAFPYGTLVINVTGSFVIGILAALGVANGRMLLPPSARFFTMAGICGGYTTFSGFSLETLVLLHEGKWPSAFAYMVLSVTLSLLAVSIGYSAALRLNAQP